MKMYAFIIFCLFNIMVFLDINAANYKEKYENSKTRLDVLNDIIKSSPNNKTFILYYMEGCRPCNATRPEWEKLKNASKKHEQDNNIAIVSIDQVLSSKVTDAKKEPNSFPTIRFITNKGNDVENYEDSDIENKDRSIDSFVEWINVKNKKQRGGKRKKNKTKKNKRRKWSIKYKKSINCRRPRGFSQKQYCKYTR